jgi:hypothetical protein
MPEPRNYRFANIFPPPDELQVGGPQMVGGVASPSSPEGAVGAAQIDLFKPGAPPKAIEGVLESGRAIASNKQELISKIIKPMKGLDDKPPAPGVRSPAEKYADIVIARITADSSIPEDAAIAMILEVWPAWSQKQYTWDTFLNFISKAAKTFSNTQDVLNWSKNLFESMQDGAPVFTPEYIMNVALDAVNTGNFTKYQNLLISLPFYKAIWSKNPIDVNDFSKSISQIRSVMELTRTPTEDMSLVLRNMKAQNEYITAFSLFYKTLVAFVTETNISELKDAKKEIEGRSFDIDPILRDLLKVEMKRRIFVDSISKGILGENPLIPKLKPKASNKIFKTVLAAGGSTTTPATGGASAGSGSSGSATSASGSGSALSNDAETARKDAFELIRTTALIEKRKAIIDNNLKQINNISEQKAKGLTGDLGLFSSLVTSGNVVQKIDQTLATIKEQEQQINKAIKLTKVWLDKHTSSEVPEIRAMGDTYKANEMNFTVQQQDLKEIRVSLTIQRIVLPKELEYFELKQDYDTNIEQLNAPVSALMVNTLVTTKDNNGKLKTVNQRVARPVAIKNVWETGKKIVALLMKISQALQAGTNNSSLGQSMLKNATNYYKAAIKQEVENNKMLMDNLANVGLGGQVNYTPVAVGKK